MAWVLIAVIGRAVSRRLTLSTEVAQLPLGASLPGNALQLLPWPEWQN